MLKLNTTNVLPEKIGSFNGLSLNTLFSGYQERIAAAVQALYQSKNASGAWTNWLNLGYNAQLVSELEAYAQSVKGQFDEIVILGIGGSSLGGYALLKALLHPYWNDLPKEKRTGPRFYFVENVDSDQMAGLKDLLDPKRTLFLVITKSGTTAETMSGFMFVKAWLDQTLGEQETPKHIAVVTDANKGILLPIAKEQGYARFEVPDDVGGRFSVFCAVGLLPAALCGISLKEIQRGIQDMDALLQNPDIHQNPAAQNALIQFLYYQKGLPISVFMPYSSRLASVADWYVQLWAESLGKKHDKNGEVVHVGPTPLKAVGVTDQHSQVQLYNEGPVDKVFTFVQVQAPDRQTMIAAEFADRDDLAYLGGRSFHDLLTAEFEATRASLTNNQRPNVTLELPRLDAYHFAQLLYFLEVQTALAGALFNVDPFDQPGVELAKQYTHALMGRPGYEHLIQDIHGQAVATAV